jgi:hypothetical protein
MKMPVPIKDLPILTYYLFFFGGIKKKRGREGSPEGGNKERICKYVMDVS